MHSSPDRLRLRPQVGVQAMQGAAHLVRVLLIYAKHDRLGQAVGLFHKVGQVPGNGFGAGERDAALRSKSSV